MSTFKNLVDETTDIKNELVECHSTLKKYLIEKGVECSDTDKIPTLINKVNDITVMPKFVGRNPQYIMANRQLNQSAFTPLIDTVETSTGVAKNKGYWIIKGEENYVYIVSERENTSYTNGCVIKYNLLDDTYEVLHSERSLIFPALNSNMNNHFFVYYHDNSIYSIYGNKAAIFDLTTLTSTSMTLGTSINCLTNYPAKGSFIEEDNVIYVGAYKLDKETLTVTQYISGSSVASNGYIPIGNSFALSMFGHLYTPSTYGHTTTVSSLEKIDIITGAKTAIDVSHIRSSYNYVASVNKKGDVLFIGGSNYSRRYGEQATTTILDGAVYYNNATSKVSYLGHVASLNQSTPIATSAYRFHGNNDNFNFIIKDNENGNRNDFIEVMVQGG